MNSDVSPLRLVVLISGNGSNLQAIIDSIRNDNLPAEIAAVISNKADAYGLQRAAQAGIPHHVLPASDYPDRQQYDQALQALVDRYHPDLVILAGFMRILSREFVEHFSQKMLNIHPSLLPKYKGLNTHQRVLEAGDREHGCSVHFVTPELDDGPLVLQAKVEVKENDTVETLAARVHREEHRIYPQAIRMFAENRHEDT